MDYSIPCGRRRSRHPSKCIHHFQPRQPRAALFAAATAATVRSEATKSQREGLLQRGDQAPRSGRTLVGAPQGAPSGALPLSVHRPHSWSSGKTRKRIFITLDSHEELTQALRFTDPQQLLRLFIFSREPAVVAPARGLLPLASQSQFTSFFTHSTPYASFSAAPQAGAIPPPSSFAAYPPRGVPPAPSSLVAASEKPAAPATVANGGTPTPSAPATIGAPAPVAPQGLLVGSPTLTAAQLFASKWEFKEQWRQEKRALKEQKYLCGNKEEWKALKKDQKKALKRQKDLAKTSHKLMKMERVFDPQDSRDHKKLYKLQQKQYKTTARALYARFVKHVSVPGTQSLPGASRPFPCQWLTLCLRVQMEPRWLRTLRSRRPGASAMRAPCRGRRR